MANILILRNAFEVHHGISHESLEFSQCTHGHLGEVFTKKLQVTPGIFHIWYTTREHCITILYYSIAENTVTNQ